MKRCTVLFLILLGNLSLLADPAALSFQEEFPFLFTQANLTHQLPIASSAYPADQWGDYSARSVFDGKQETAWVEGSAGDGIGEKLLFKLPIYIFRLNVMPGYALPSVFKVNNRIKKIRLTFYCASLSREEWTNWKEMGLALGKLLEMEVAFKDVMQFQGFALPDELAELPEGYNTLLCLLEILEVYKGHDADTSLAEIKLIGQPPPGPGGMLYGVYGGSGGTEYKFFSDGTVTFEAFPLESPEVQFGNWVFDPPEVVIQWHTIEGRRGKGEVVFAGAVNEYAEYEPFTKEIARTEILDWQEISHGGCEFCEVRQLSEEDKLYHY